MLKRNYFLIIPLLVVMALVFGASGGAYAKQWPNCPAGDDVDHVGPAINGHIRCFYNESGNQAIEFDLSCGNLNYFQEIETEWVLGDTESGEPALQESDLVVHGSPDDRLNFVFGILDSDLRLALMPCYRETDTNAIFCLMFWNVRNFVEVEPNEEYTMDVMFMRAIPPRH